MNDRLAASEGPASTAGPVPTRATGGAVVVAGWVVLGALGPRHAPLWAGGLLPLALGLGVAGGTTVHAVRSRGLAARGWRAIARLAAAGTLASLAGVVGGPGGPVALGLAAVCWGVWVGALAGRTAAGGGGDHPGRLACALPSPRAGEWRTASAWGPLAARWSMVPMMATLGLMGGWCGAPGGGWGADAIALHLLAMVLPAVALTSLRIRLDDGAWAAAAMAAAGLALCGVPGLRGLMLASGLQAVGWGLAAAIRPTAGTPRPAVGGSAWSSACPALLVLGLGLAIDRGGPAALGAVQAALSAVGAAGLVARALGLARTASRRRRWVGARSG